MLVSCSDPIAFHPDFLHCSLVLPVTSDFQSLFRSLDLYLGHPESSEKLDVLLFFEFVNLKLHVLGLHVGLSEAVVAIAGQPFDLFHHSCLVGKARLVQKLAELVGHPTNPSAQYSHIIVQFVQSLEAIGHCDLAGGKELRLLCSESLIREVLRILDEPKPLVKGREYSCCSDLELSVIFCCSQTPREVSHLDAELVDVCTCDVLVEVELIHVG